VFSQRSARNIPGFCERICPYFPGGQILLAVRNHSVTGGNSLRIGVRSKGQAVPWPSGPDVTLGTIRRWDLRGGGGGQGLPPPSRIFGPFVEFRFLPADASGAYRPNPKANNQTCSVPPSLNGYLKTEVTGLFCRFQFEILTRYNRKQKNKRTVAMNFPEIPPTPLWQRGARGDF